MNSSPSVEMGGDEQIPHMSNNDRAMLFGFQNMPKPRFAVIDGARFGHLAEWLKAVGLSCQSLFLEHADEEIERAGGWLVPVDGEADYYTLLQLPGSLSSMVFWSCPSGEAALLRHLRTINVIQIPADTEEINKDSGESNLPYQQVLFRHYDPQVLASLLPIMGESQFARIFGPANYILMHDEASGGVRSAPRPDVLPIAPKGPLHIDAEQIAELELVRNHASTMKVARYLREVDSENTKHLSDGQLTKFVEQSEKSGKELGLKSELAIGYWSYLLLGSNGAIAQKPFVRDYLSHYPEKGTPDDKIYTLMNQLSSKQDKPFKSQIS